MPSRIGRRKVPSSRRSPQTGTSPDRSNSLPTNHLEQLDDGGRELREDRERAILSREAAPPTVPASMMVSTGKDAVRFYHTLRCSGGTGIFQRHNFEGVWTIVDADPLIDGMPHYTHVTPNGQMVHLFRSHQYARWVIGPVPGNENGWAFVESSARRPESIDTHEFRWFVWMGYQWGQSDFLVFRGCAPDQASGWYGRMVGDAADEAAYEDDDTEREEGLRVLPLGAERAGTAAHPKRAPIRSAVMMKNYEAFPEQGLSTTPTAAVGGAPAALVGASSTCSACGMGAASGGGANGIDEGSGIGSGMVCASVDGSERSGTAVDQTSIAALTTAASASSRVAQEGRDSSAGARGTATGPAPAAEAASMPPVLDASAPPVPPPDEAIAFLSDAPAVAPELAEPSVVIASAGADADSNDSADAGGSAGAPPAMASVATVALEATPQSAPSSNNESGQRPKQEVGPAIEEFDEVVPSALDVQAPTDSSTGEMDAPSATTSSRAAS